MNRSQNSLAKMEKNDNHAIKGKYQNSAADQEMLVKTFEAIVAAQGDCIRDDKVKLNRLEAEILELHQVVKDRDSKILQLAQAGEPDTVMGIIWSALQQFDTLTDKWNDAINDRLFGKLKTEHLEQTAQAEQAGVASSDTSMGGSWGSLSQFVGGIIAAFSYVPAMTQELERSSNSMNSDAPAGRVCSP
jgi:hypothetical protein